MTFGAILGAAGTGKSTLLAQRQSANPNYCKLTATTGIAAVNLGVGVTTVNSALGYFNDESAEEGLHTGRMAGRFCKLADQGYENLVIDEVSMMSKRQLWALCAANLDANRMLEQRQLKGIGLLLTGDFLQLPPIKGEFAFLSKTWKSFELNIELLTKVYRQTNPIFLDALNAARAGKGTTATMKLKEAGVNFVGARDDYFDGTSLVSTNATAALINGTRFADLDVPITEYKSARWGQEQSEWKEIPAVLEMKIGAAVMVLANEPGSFCYVNGDQGILREVTEFSAIVEVQRGQQFSIQEIPFVWRETVQMLKPDGVQEFAGFLINGMIYFSLAEVSAHYKAKREWTDEADLLDEVKEMNEKVDRERRLVFAQFIRQYDSYVTESINARRPYYNCDQRKWVVGWVEYMPLRLAWASTIHKSQGLTLDRVQIDARDRFAGNAAMQYVALSRCRTPENIRVVCDLATFSRRIQTSAECLRWV